MKTLVNLVSLILVFCFLYVASVGTARLTLFIAKLPLYPGDTYGQSR